MPVSLQSHPDVMRWRAASCTCPVLHRPSTASAGSKKRTTSPCPECLGCPTCPLLCLRSPNSCHPFPFNWLSYPNKSPSKFPKSPSNSKTCLPSYPSAFPASPRSFPASHNSCPTFHSNYPTSHKSCPAFHNGFLYSRNRYPTYRNTSLLFHKKYPAFHKGFPAFGHVLTNLSQSRMPKQQPQQNRELELDHLVRQSPLHSPRTPSPSYPSSVLDHPNVPSYPRLPPITPSRQLSGVSNPALHIQDDPTSARPSGDPRHRLCLLD